LTNKRKTFNMSNLRQGYWGLFRVNLRFVKSKEKKKKSPYWEGTSQKIRDSSGGYKKGRIPSTSNKRSEGSKKESRSVSESRKKGKKTLREIGDGSAIVTLCKK